MKIIVDSIQTRVIIGGSDYLVDFKLFEVLRNYMSVEVKGSFFAAKHTKFNWDGKRYFLTPSGKMATGFLPVFLKFLEEEYPDVEIEIEDKRGSIPVFKKDFVTQIGELTINEQYEHQKFAIQSLNNYINFRGQKIYFPRGVIDAATNAGKTNIMAGTLLNLEGEHNMLVIIHRKPVFRQLCQFFRETFNEEIGEINDKKKTFKHITIAMIQSLDAHIGESSILNYLSSVELLAVDEAHRAGSKMYAKVISRCPAPIRLFVSGSSFDSDDPVSRMTIVGLSGNRLFNIKKRELMDKGISTPVVIHMHLSNTILHYPIIAYDDCLNCLIYESSERISLMSKIIRDRVTAGPVLIIVEKAEHGKYLFSNLVAEGFNIEMTYSEDKDIRGKIEAYTAGDFDILISTGVLKEGINMPLISTIINAAGGKSKIFLKQWLGRGERLSFTKSVVEFHDFYDIGKFVQKHSMERIALYKQEELEIVYHYDQSIIKRMRLTVVE